VRRGGVWKLYGERYVLSCDASLAVLKDVSIAIHWRGLNSFFVLMLISTLHYAFGEHHHDDVSLSQSLSSIHCYFLLGLHSI